MQSTTRNRVIAAVLFVGSALWGWLALQLPESFVKGVPGPSFFPLTIVGAMMILSALLFFSKAEEEGGGFNRRQLAVFALMFAYVAAIPHAGFPLTTAAVLFAILLFTRKLSPGSAALTSAVITGALFLIFGMLLKIPLPTGEWFA